MSFDLTTFLFQTANFLVLAFILWRLLFKPLRAHMAGRAQRIERGLSEVASGREEVAETQRAADGALEAARRKESDAVRRAEAAAEARRVEMLEDARREATAVRERLLSQVGEEAARKEREFLRGLTPAISKLLARLLSELGDDARLHERTCERLAERLGAMAEVERANTERAADGGPIELVVAREPVPPALPAAVAALLPAGARFEVRVDSSLVAGATLRVGELIYDGSAQAQLRRALVEAA